MALDRKFSRLGGQTGDTAEPAAAATRPRPRPPTADPELLACARVLPDRYRVRAMLGRGGMGVVLEAHDHHLARDVAIKVLPASAWADDGARLRFVREARAAAILRDPSLVTVHELSADGHYIVMELVRGETLRDRLGARGPLPAAELRRLGLALCRALGVAHDAGIVHRDVKPSNILYDERDAIRLADFGVASFADSELTLPGVAVGSPAYMAPEQLRGGAVDRRADVYGAGASLFEAATGGKLHGAAGSCRDPRKAVLAATADAALASAIARAVAEAPADRFADVAALAAALGPARPRRRARHAAALLAIFAVASLVGGRLHRGPVAAAGPARPLTIALLPFTVDLGDPSLGFTGVGVPYLFGRELARAHGVEVIGHLRILDNLKPDAHGKSDPFATAVELGADLVVRGELRDADDGYGLHLHAELVDRAGTRLGTVDHDTTAEALPIMTRLAAVELLELGTAGRIHLELSANTRFEAERELQLGLAAMRADDFPGALGHLKTALAYQPDFADAQYYRGLVTWWASGSPDATLPVIRQALTTDLRADQRDLLTAMIPLVEMRFPAAVDGFRPVAARYPTNPDVLYGWFEALWHGGQPRAAVAVYQQIHRLLPGFRFGVLHPLTYHVSRGETDGLGWLFDGILEDARNRIWAVRDAFARRDYARASALLRQMTAGFAGAVGVPESRDMVGEAVQLLAVQGQLHAAMLAAGDPHAGDGSLLMLGLSLAAGDRAGAERWEATARHLTRALSGYAHTAQVLTLAQLAAASGRADWARASQADLDTLELPYRRSLTVHGLRLFLDEVTGDERAIAAEAASPFPEVAAIAAGLAAERASRTEVARAAWRAARAASGDGRFLLAEELHLARLAARAGDPADALAHCDAVDRPRLFTWSWAGLVAPCLALEADAARALGRSPRAALLRLLDLRVAAEPTDPLVRAATHQLKELPDDDPR